MAYNPVDPLQDAMRDFRANLTSSQDAELITYGHDLDATTILVFTAEIDKVNASRRSRCVSSRLFGILQSVLGFSGVVDTFVSSNPDIAALVWGSLKLTIRAVNNIVSFFDKLSEVFLRLGGCCPKYSEYQSLFADSIRIQTALCKFYASIVNFCTQAIKTLANPDILGSVLVQALWRPFETEFSSFEASLRMCSKEIKGEITLAGEQAAARERMSASKYRTSGSIFRTEFRQKSKQEEEWRLQVDKGRTDAIKAKLLDHLSTYDYIRTLKRIRRKRYGTAGSWVSETRGFKNWLEDSECGVLWLSGILGSGKTVATVAALDDLLRRPRKSNEHIGLFFSEHDFAESLEARSIIACLIRQCLSVETLCKSQQDKLETIFRNTYPDAEDFELLLHDVVKNSGGVTFIIDGPNECSQADRTTILGILSRVMVSSGKLIKILLTSREGFIEDIRRVFKTFHEVLMNCREADADVKIYVEGMIEKKIKSGELIVGQIELVQGIVDALIHGANGMFLWVALQINDLCRQRCDADIRRSIAQLPNGLPEIYRRVLSRIVEDGQTEIANKTFRWVAAAKRPLLLVELREAIAIEPEDRHLNKDRLVNGIDRLPSWCGDLVIVDDEDPLVQFVHHSVKDFLVSEQHRAETKGFHFGLADVDLAAGEACIVYLNFNDFKQ